MKPISYFAFRNSSIVSPLLKTRTPCPFSHGQQSGMAQLAIPKNEFLYRTATKGGIVPMIGLEVHAQLDLKSKLFSQGKNSDSSIANSELDLFDISLPGTLPKLNKNALHAAILTSLGLNCSIQKTTHFDRKNYFYSDMPAGYQITQYNSPIAKNGFVEFLAKTYHRSIIAHSQQYDLVKYLYSDDRIKGEEFEPYIKKSRIKQIQLEQDSAKSLHNIESNGSQRANYSLVDYNRSGAALIEIVFEPDLANHHEASSLVSELILILKSLKTCNCELQEGSLRVDANVSIRELDGQIVENTGRVELKNLNSIKSLNRAIAHEVFRQAKMLRSGGQVMQESRSYDSKSKSSIPLREKEDAVDYRYVPEPSIPPITIDESLIQKARSELPAIMPKDIRDTLINQFNLDLILVADVTEQPGLYEYFIQIMNNHRSQYDANVVADFLVYAIANLKDIVDAPIPVDLTEGSEFLKRLHVEKMQSLFEMMLHDEISFMIAYEVMKLIYISDDQSDPRKIVNDAGWYQINDEVSVEELCNNLISKMKKTSLQYRKKGDKKYMRMMLDKLCELTGNKISVKKAMYTLDNLLRKQKELDTEI